MRPRALCLVTWMALLFGIVALRVAWSARAEWRLAAAATGEDELRHLGRAARLTVPLSPYGPRALERLAVIGRTEPARAVAAYAELRAALFATRTLALPHPELLDEANRRLAAGRARQLSELEATAAPSPGWTLFALFGFALWLASAFGLVRLAIGGDARLRPRRALLLGAALVLGLSAFFIGLGRA